MATKDDTPAANKMKRTAFSPWSSAALGKATSKKVVPSPEPGRIVSDLVMQSTEEAAKGNGGSQSGLYGHPKILALQAEWEKKQPDVRDNSPAGSANTESSLESETGGKQTPVEGPENSAAQRSLPGSRPSASTPQTNTFTKITHKRRPTTDAPNTSQAQKDTQPPMGTFNNSAKEHARRFTEEAVMKQMEYLTRNTTKAQPESPGPSKPSMIFPTGNDLLQRIRNDNLMKPPTSASVIKGSPSPTTSTDSTKQTPIAAPKDGDVLTPILVATDGRLYSQYPRPDGTRESGRGALIPANYKLHDDPETPCICPVRDCRRLFPGIKGLGGHFGAGHCFTTLNDNGDGTLSKVGTYNKHSTRGSPAIIISQNPLPPDAPPMADPGIPYQAANNKRAASSSAPRTSETGQREASRESTRTSSSSNIFQSSQIVEYLHKFLNPLQKSFRREDIQIMIRLPRQRDLPQSWIDAHQSTQIDVTQYSCAIAYLVGKEVTGSAACIAYTRHNPRPTARLSSPCIALPHNVYATAKNQFSPVETCVGCRYWAHLQRRSISCDWAGVSLKPRGSAFPRTSTPTSGSASVSVTEEAGNVSEPMEVDKPEPEQLTMEERRAKRELRRERKEERRKRRYLASVSKEQQTFSGAAVQPTQLSGVDLEMEEWEVAPGRMKNDDSSENIAFSNSYLTSGQPITVSDDISFNVLVIKPGSFSHWDVEDDKLRTCSIGSGKVKVTMGEKVFQLGRNGMFVVRPGQTCKIENRLYVDSVVHCTTIADFELQ
ncbi:Fc.00g047020.m01.CDS01 [Cosmosporella sp. VM-42]